MTVKSRSEKVLILILYLALLVLQIGFGMRKQGFHEDEYYSYYSSNRTAGFLPVDGTLVSTSDIRNELVVLPTERFRFSIVKEVQTWDVHPPLYYEALHAVCSFVPGVFTKWTGIGLNLCAFTVSFFLLERIAKKLRMHFVARLTLLILFGCNPAVISMNLFIRMYAWLTVWVLCNVYLQLHWEEGARTKWIYVAVALCDFCGFLTHYYYLIFVVAQVLVLFVRSLSLSKGAHIHLLLAHAFGFAIAILDYPHALVHILRGYRGKEAVEAFFSVTNLWERLTFFAGVLFDELFAGGWLLAGAALGLGMTFFLKRKWDCRRFVPLAVTTLLYILVVAKSALLLGATSIRYLAPVCPLLLLLLTAVASGGAKVCDKREEKQERGGKERYVLPFSCVALVLGAVLSLFANKVLFLYSEEAERLAFDASHKDATVVVAYNPETKENVWRLAGHLLQFEQVFFLEEGSAVRTEKALIADAGEMLIFAADADTKEEVLRGLAGERAVQTAWSREMWTLYDVSY